MKKIKLLILFVIATAYADAQFIGREGYNVWMGGAYFGHPRTGSITAPIESVWAQFGDSATTKAIRLPMVQHVADIATPRRAMFMYCIDSQSVLFNNGLTWKKVGGDVDMSAKADTGSVWKRTGNGGTTGTDFIGTTDNKGLQFRVNNTVWMQMPDSFAAYTGNNFFYGRRAGENIVPAMTNQIYGIGNYALRNMRHGGGDIGIGEHAFELLSDDGAGYGSASENLGVGHWMGFSQTYGYKNAFFGHYINNVIGYQNSIFGVHGMEESYSATRNAGLGESVLRWNLRGSYNSATGNAAQYLSTTVIGSVTVLAEGSGYGVNDTVVVVPAPRASMIPGLPHTQAVVRAEIEDGKVIAATVVNPGNGYGYRIGNDTLVVTTSTGSGAIIIAEYVSADYNTSDGAASLYFNEYGRYLSSYGYASGYGAGGNEASLKDSNSVFLGAYASRSAKIPRTTALKNVTAIGFDAKVGQNDLIALGRANTKVTIGKDTIVTNPYSATTSLDASVGDVLAKRYVIYRPGTAMNSDYFDDAIIVTSNTSGFTRSNISNSGTHPDSYAGHLFSTPSGTAFVRTGYNGITELAGYISGGYVRLNNNGKMLDFDATGKLIVKDGEFNAKHKSVFDDTIRYNNAPTGVKKYFITMDDSGYLHRSDTIGLYGGSGGGGSSDSSVFLVDTTYNPLAGVYGTDTLVVKSLRMQYNGSTVTPTVTDSTISWNITGLSNPMTTTGDIIYSSDNSGTPARLGAGTSGYVLTSNGAGVAPSWQAAAGGGLTIGTTPISSSTSRGILYDSSGVLKNRGDVAVFTTGELGIGYTAAQGYKLSVNGSIKGTSAVTTGTGTFINGLFTSGGFSTSHSNSENADLYVRGGTTASTTTQSEIRIGGASTTGNRASFRGSANYAMVANNSYGGVIFGKELQTEASSGTHALYAKLAIRQDSVVNGTASTTHATSLYIQGPPTTNGSFGTSTAMWIESGDVLLSNGILTATNGLKTGNPGSGVGTWKLGTAVTTSGLTLNTATYVEISIGGTVYRLAVVDPPQP